MAIRKREFIKKCDYLGIIGVTLLIMSIIVTGCTQTSSTNPGTSAATVSPTDSGNNANSQNGVSIALVTPGQQGTNVTLTGAFVHGHYVSNITPMMAAAQNLGVPESALISALTPPPDSHVINYTYAAAQLSMVTGTTITPDQLMAALR
ncbi:MAG: hypothetical protein WCE46_01995 [Methanoregula sp.]|uniref:hypothetical protein n=1 Tax=Methanoregula sp. TaxID=2052170 RepID=UPI003C77A104